MKQMKQNSKNIDRRNFLRISAAAGAGAAFFPKDVNASAIRPTPGTAKIEQNIEIPVRTLGRTGLQVPILSMGVMRADNPSVVRAAYNSGIKFFDTANNYQQGRNEEMLGTFFEDKPRDSFIIATKASLEYPLVEKSIPEFEEKVETSLKRLKMSYVDIFYIHGPRTAEALLDEQVIATIKKVKDSGKARFIGFSTHAPDIPAQIDAAVKAGIYDVILTSYNFKQNFLDRMNPAIERAAAAGIGFVVMKALTGGVEDAEGKTKVNGQACLKWVWQNKNITTVIPGFTNYDLLDDCLAAVKSPTLNDDEKKYLASLQNKEMLYCQQCGQCAGQCPEKLPIPDLMRAYMYAFGYKQAQLSKETLATLQFSDNPCSTCVGGCKVNCPSGFNVRTKIAAIQPIRNVPDVFLT